MFQLFVYLFAPLYNHLKDIDFKTNLRLENGVKIWSPMSEFTHPEAPCFTAHCKPKPRTLWWRSSKLSKPQPATADVFVGSSKFFFYFYISLSDNITVYYDDF